METGEFILLVIVGIIYWIYRMVENKKVDNYDTNKVSIGKMACDAGKSPRKIRRNMVNGNYDKDDQWKI